jgi:mannosyltransferase OCH1-like enzyme
MQIPRKIHMIWIGEENLPLPGCIDSWKNNHPQWQFKLWTDADLEPAAWINQSAIEAFIKAKAWAAIADVMRYEILYREGGVYADADSRSLRPLDPWLLENEMFACWVNTMERGRKLVNNAFLGSVPGNPFLRYVIDEIARKHDLFARWSWSRLRYVRMGAWRSVGPWHLTRCMYDYRGTGYHNLTVLPSHMFSPVHFRGDTYTGNGTVYAEHGWGSTRGLYKKRDLQSAGQVEQDLHVPLEASLEAA